MRPRLWRQAEMSGFENLIREKAYQLWERAGRPDGRNDEFWHAAKHDLEAEPAPVEKIPASPKSAAEGSSAPKARAPLKHGGPASRRRRSARAE